MDDRQALYSIEQGDDIRYYKAAKEYTIGDILNVANLRACCGNNGTLRKKHG